MLTNTFCHIPGIGEKKERDLWAAGVTSWDCPWDRASPVVPRCILEHWPRHIRESIRNHASGNPGYFASMLPSKQLWRLFRDFQDTTAFLDIETTGLYGGDIITTIALYDGKTIRHYVNGDNLGNFTADVMNYRLLVTYNGKCFDIPFIERFFNIRLPQAHIDLRYPLRSLGLKGGLKGCERQVGIDRKGLDGVDGYGAVLLWHEYKRRKDVKALETLLAYNIQDTLSLHALMVHTYNAKIRATPFASSHVLELPAMPESPFQADGATVERVVGQVFGTRFGSYAEPGGLGRL
jgi:uncharacterized protein